MEKKQFCKKDLHRKPLEHLRWGLHYCTQAKDYSMHYIPKIPNPTGKATAAAVATAVAACAACCIPLVTPMALSLLASVGMYCANDVLRNDWWLAGAAVLVASPLLVWRWRVARQRAAVKACATDCSCKPANSA